MGHAFFRRVKLGWTLLMHRRRLTMRQRQYSSLMMKLWSVPSKLNTQDFKWVQWGTMVQWLGLPALYGPYTACDIQNLEVVQRWLTQFTTNNHKRTGDIVTNILKDLQWLSLEQRRKSNRLAIMNKIQNDQITVPQALSFRNACCATNSTSQDIQVSCRCAFCI